MEFSHGGGGGSEDFQEEQVWAVMRSAREGSSKSTRKNSSSSSSLSPWRINAGGTSPRPIPGATGEACAAAERRHSSAPVDIPDWSKILKTKSKKLWDDACCASDGDGGDDDDRVPLPPHEYLAGRHASTQIASYSMCEGVGRTLKGRDLSKLRNAILTKTGFIE